MKGLLRACFLTLILVALSPAVAMASVSTSNKPTITGQAVVGKQLTCHDAGGWSSTDSGTPTPSDWLFYYATNTTTPILDTGDGAINTYDVQKGDIGHQIVCKQVEADGGAGDSTTFTTAASTATLAVVAGAPPTNNAPPTIDGVPQVGVQLTCNPGSWSPPSVNDTIDATDYSWFNGATLVHDGGTDNTYTPVVADIGKTLHCVETETDEDTAGSATAPSAALTAVTPLAGVTISRYSPTVSGNIGENVAGVQVTLTLKRPTGGGQPGTTTVASASGTTSGTGAWSLTLTPTAAGPPDGFGAAGDTLTVQYSGGATVPVNATYTVEDLTFEGQDSSISSNGQTVTGPNQNGCPALSFIVDNVSHATSAAGLNCTFVPGTALTDNNHVQASFTDLVQAADGHGSNVTTVDDVGLLATGTVGRPSCSADYVFGVVTCSELNGGTFSVSRNGGTAVALTSTPDGGGALTFTGRAHVPGLAAGDQIALKEGNLARSLTTLHLVTLRADLSDFGVVSGSCQANKQFTDASALCPAGGTMSSTAGGTGLLDDLSGGSTLVIVPSLANQIPSAGDSMPGGNWTAYADLAGPGTTTEILSAVQSVNLTVEPRAGGGPVVNQNMTPGSDAVGPFESLTLAGPLSVGRYFADWTLTDVHGDTAASSTEFAQQPGGAQGPPGQNGQNGQNGINGARGPQGPPGKNGTSSEVKCTITTTGSGKHKKTHEVCKVIVLSPGSHLVSVDISRGRRTYATGTAVVRGGVAKLRLNLRGRFHHGTYLITLVTTDGTKATVIRLHRRL